MKLIADSGSTKTRWVLTGDKMLVKSFKTRGMNPYFQSPDEINLIIKEDVLPQLDDVDINTIHFYGAGCTLEKKDVVFNALVEGFPESRLVTVESDVLGAARGLCGKRAGIACILGTGSNSCFYNGREIVESVPALGYILGDEGSGAVMGRTLVSNLLKNQMSPGLKERFLDRYELTIGEIVERVYHQPYPNRFLASLSPFLLENINVPELRQLVLDGFMSFIKRNVMQYAYQMYPVYFTGSVSYHYHQILFEAASRCEIKISSIVKSPMDGLMIYHA